MKLPPILAALVNRMVGDLRPVSEWDRSALLGADPRRQDPEQSGSPYSFANRDSRPYPAAVMLPVVIGFNAIPLETPTYYRGSLWDEGWERRA